MSLKINVPVSSPSTTNTALGLNLASPSIERSMNHSLIPLEDQTTATPLSRKRKLAIQFLHQHDYGGAASTLDNGQCALMTPNTCPHSMSTSADYLLEPGSYSDRNNTVTGDGRERLTNKGKYIAMDDKLDYMQQQASTLWSREKSATETSIPASLSHSHQYQLLQQYDSPEDHNNQQQQQQQQQHQQLVTTIIGHSDNRFLEYGGTTTTPAFLDWSTTLHSSTEGVIVQNQCLNHSIYSACTTGTDGDSGTPSYLGLDSLEHKQQSSDHATPIYSIGDQYHHLEVQQQQLNNDIRQKYRESDSLSLDLKNLSNTPLTVTQDEESPMTPSLFSPTFIDALDDICMRTAAATMDLDGGHYQGCTTMANPSTTSNILTTASKDYTYSSTSDSCYDWQTVNQNRQTLDNHYHNTITPQFTNGNNASTDILSEQNMPIMGGSATSLEDQTMVQQSHHAFSAHMDEFNGSQRRRSSNNTVSTKSSNSDNLVTSASHMNYSPIQPSGQPIPLLHLSAAYTTPRSPKLPISSSIPNYGTSTSTTESAHFIL
ncbi:unnamed protein product [Absidia cylindrospora]